MLNIQIKLYCKMEMLSLERESVKLNGGEKLVRKGSLVSFL